MRNWLVRSCSKEVQARGTVLPPTMSQGARTVFVKGHIILHEGLEVPALPHHELHGLLPVPQVVPGVPLQLVPQRPEQAVTAEGKEGWVCLRQQKESLVTGEGVVFILPGLAGIWMQRSDHSLCFERRLLLEGPGLSDRVTVNLLGQTDITQGTQSNKGPLPY